ncbi:MAG: hypothetical protein PHO57_05390 [Acidithiobacillus sp.]|nr:hypothetical protein [Acidithiobacillus sp.]
MKIADLIRKGGLAQVATAIPATVATKGENGPGTVAKIATIAIANPLHVAGRIALAIVRAGGGIWVDNAGKLQVEQAPAWLLPLLDDFRHQIVQVLTDIWEEGEERKAIQTESEAPPFTDLHRIDNVPGFAGVTPITDAERLLMNLRLLRRDDA